MTPAYIPQAINAPYRMICLTVDEWFPFALCNLWGAIHDHILTGLISGALGVIACKIVKNRHRPRFWLRLLYWYAHGSWWLGLQASPPAHMRMLRG